MAFSISPLGWLVSVKKLLLDALLPTQSKIIGGKDAEKGQYPHNVFIKTINHQDRKVRVCGGTLITDRHVLTAAHCIYEVDYIVMVFGSIYPAFTSGVAMQFAFQKDFVIHPNFVPRNLKNDIAIIKLSRPLPLTGRVNTIRLPRLGKSSPLFYEGKEGIVTGWGITSDDNRKMAGVLQQATVRIMRQYAGRTWFGFFGYELMNSQLCSQYSRYFTGTCFGDSGGPLIMRERDGRWTLVGVTSFGDKKCTGEVPSVYTNVAIFLPWIRKEAGIKLRRR
uniref:Chymotrypsinogen 2 n=2 Tax=Lygus hesperus TaxID=30085 RepID=A0A146LWJ7_LYGHE